MMAVSPGDTVEVCFQEDGLQGSYFVAKVLHKNSNRCLVEYTTLLTENEKEFLREVVNVHRVRPLAPEIKVSDFHMSERVDVYGNDGWWEGRIVGKYGSIYSVYFDKLGISEIHHVSRIRPHQEYVDGKWTASAEREYLYANRVA